MKYYVVWVGQNPGIYTSWDECRQQIHNFNGAKYKSFSDSEEAAKAYRMGYEAYYQQAPPKSRKPTGVHDLPPQIDRNGIAVDAACSGNPGVLEYRGVELKTGREIFRQGPFPQGTVNIGEFLALVHGLALLKQKKLSAPVYTDSRTAISWVRNKKIKTNLERNPVNESLFQLIDRAIYWLKTNSFQNEIIKWNTAEWGEIPADFGRK
ncbi:MAG: ribonuclease H family protein [Bacteroidales bacterium]